MMRLPLRCVTSLSEVGLLHSESEAGGRSVLSTFLLSLSRISVLHKRRCSEFIAQDSRPLPVLTWFYCDSPLFMSYVQHQHLSEWLLLQNENASHRDPDKASSASYVSLLRVRAQLTLQTGHQPLVRVVRHQTHQLHPPLDLCAHMELGQNFRRWKQTQQAWGEWSSRVFQPTHERSAKSKHRSCSSSHSSLNFPSGSRCWNMMDDVSAVSLALFCSCTVTTGDSENQMEGLMADKQHAVMDFSLLLRTEKVFLSEHTGTETAWPTGYT